MYVRLAEGADIQCVIRELSEIFASCTVQISRPFSKIVVVNKDAAALSRTIFIEALSEDCLFNLKDYIKAHYPHDFIERIPLIDLLYVPNDTYYTDNIVGAKPSWLFDLIGAEQAWDIHKGDSSVSVAVIDNAIWTAHPDLAGKFVDEWDFADNDNSAIPASDANTAQGRQWSHGTHVAGLVGAKTDNNMGIASIGFNVSLRAYKMYTQQVGLPWPDLNAGVQAIIYAADSGANVINISWGTTNQMQTLESAVSYVYNKGVVVVAAAGNNGEEQMYYPAASPGVIAVTSVGMDDKLSYFSNYGAFVDLTAPGGYGPTDVGTWSLVSTTYHDAYAWASILGPVKYDGKVGTSMAAPVVSGLCGLMLSKAPQLTPDEVLNILKITSTDISALNPSYTGKIGAGRIHAGNAMQYISNMAGTQKPSDEENFQLYPNPCADVLRFVHPSGNQWRIVDLIGKTVASGTFSSGNMQNIPVNSLNEGIYVLQISAGSMQWTKKFAIYRK